MLNIEQKKGEWKTVELKPPASFQSQTQDTCLSHLVRRQSAALFKMLYRNKWTIWVGLKSVVFNK